MNIERFSELTDLQLQCLRLYAAPMRAKEIAAQLGLSVRSIEGLLARATKKLGANSTVEAARALANHEREDGGKIPAYFPPVDSVGTEPAPSLGVASTSDVPPGRNIRLGTWQRTGIMLALTGAMILSLMAIVAISEGVTRLAHAYYATER